MCVSDFLEAQLTQILDGHCRMAQQLDVQQGLIGLEFKIAPGLT